MTSERAGRFDFQGILYFSIDYFGAHCVLIDETSN